MALFEETIDDSASVADGATTASAFALSASDSATVTDSLSVTNGRDIVVAIGDTIASSDAVVVLRVTEKIVSDDVVVSDALRVGVVQLVRVSDAVVATDSLVSEPILALFIQEARALSERKVRVDFSAPMQIDDALRRPSSYVFDNLTPGSVEVVPLAVTLPAGQQNPLFVEIDVTEHTETAMYAVALSPALRGAANETSVGEPFEYVGIGARPTLQLVLAMSANEVDVFFNEPILNNSTARDRSRYQWTGGISTIDVKRIVENVVTLQTTTQTPGALYSLTVVGIDSGVV